MKRQQRKPSGLTLTELLVVVTIMVLVAGAMVPVIQPIIKGKSTREAAKIVRGIFVSAQTQAVAKQRPVGVWISRAANEIIEGRERRIYTSYQLALAEQPSPYSGDVEDARVRLANQELVNNLPPPSEIQDRSSYLNQVNYAIASYPEVASAEVLLKPGDQIRFGYRNEWLTLADFPRPLVLTNDCDGEIINPVMVFTYYDPPDDFQRRLEDKYMPIECGASGERMSLPMSFQVARQPRKTAAPPVDLPNNAAIDLSVSGMEDDLLARFRYFQTVPTEPPIGTIGDRYRAEACPEHDIVIMFNANGEVDRIHYLDNNPGFQSGYCRALREAFKVQRLPRTREVMGPIYLMIGRDDLIGIDLNEQPNFYDGNGNINPFMGISSLNEKTNIWLTLNRNLINTSPNAGFNTRPTEETAISFYQPVRDSRQLTKSGFSSGGR